MAAVTAVTGSGMRHLHEIYGANDIPLFNGANSQHSPNINNTAAAAAEQEAACGFGHCVVVLWDLFSGPLSAMTRRVRAAVRAAAGRQ